MSSAATAPLTDDSEAASLAHNVTDAGSETVSVNLDDVVRELDIGEPDLRPLQIATDSSSSLQLPKTSVNDSTVAKTEPVDRKRMLSMFQQLLGPLMSQILPTKTVSLQNPTELC